MLLVVEEVAEVEVEVEVEVEEEEEEDGWLAAAVWEEAQLWSLQGS